MRLKNYQEDVVLNLISIALEDRPELRQNEDFIRDVTAYTLNRIPPRYLTSERGFTRFVTDTSSVDQSVSTMPELINIMIVVNKAISVVEKRRRAPDWIPQAAGTGDHRSVLTHNEFIHNFPQIIGKVLENDDAPATGAVITLYVNEKPALSEERTWPNPYVIAASTKGYYSFWPRSLVSRNDSLSVVLRVSVEKEGCYRQEFAQLVTTKGEYQTRDLISEDAILHLPPCTLVRETD